MRAETAPPTTAAIAAVVTGGVIVGIVRGVDGITGAVAIGAVGALLLAVGLSVDAAAVGPVPAAIVRGVLVVPAGGAVGVGLGLTAVSVGGTVFPIPDASLISLSALTIAGHVGVTVGVTVAVLGVGLGVSGRFDGTAVRRLGYVAFLTALGPTAVAGTLTVRGLLTADAPVTIPELSIPDLWAVAVDPTGQTLGAWSFLLLVAAGLAALWAAIAVLPIRAVVDGRVGENRPIDRQLDRVVNALRLGTFVAAVLVPVAGGIEATFGPEEIADLIGTGAYDGLAAITTAGWLRRALLGLAVLGLATAGPAWLVRGLGRSWARERSNPVVPVVVGTAVALGAWTVAEPVYAAIVEQTISRLPEPIQPRWREVADETATVYGEPALVLWLVVAAAVVAIAAVVGLWGARGLGYLRGSGGGYALAGAGLFVAAAFAGTIEVSRWLVFAAVAASLTVWDLGRFGTALRHEARGANTRSLELAHAGATVVVGLAGIGLAAGLASVAGGAGGETPATAALVAAVVGLVLLVAALR